MHRIHLKELYDMALAAGYAVSTCYTMLCLSWAQHSLVLGGAWLIYRWADISIHRRMTETQPIGYLFRHLDFTVCKINGRNHVFQSPSFEY